MAIKTSLTHKSTGNGPNGSFKNIKYCSASDEFATPTASAAEISNKIPPAEGDCRNDLIQAIISSSFLRK